MAAPADQNLYAVSGSLWARKLASKETAEAFHASWDQACDAVEYVVSRGLVNLQVFFEWSKAYVKRGALYNARATTDARERAPGLRSPRP
jgi:16S rRNA G527 N7-methylase RsmG